MRYSYSLLPIALLCLITGISVPAELPSTGWQEKVDNRIAFFGHRNWIVIADSAYPAQSRAAIETIVSNADHLTVIQHVLASLKASKHVKPIIYTDKELKFVPEKDAPGISAYRERLAKFLQNQEVNAIAHEQIISKLDQAGQIFRVLIIKTNMTVPYTSVFLELDCAYWNADAERRLRTAIAARPAR